MKKQEVLPPETLTPSCKNANDLAREIGVLVSKATGVQVEINSMLLGMGNVEGDDVTINWKRGMK